MICTASKRLIWSHSNSLLILGKTNSLWWKMLASDSNAGRGWSEKRMEEIESVRTIERLRGRLLAERAATKLAKQQAALLENKLIELEYKQSQETNFKNKAEKKLAFLLNKLESLNINYVLKDSQNSLCQVSIAAEDAKEQCTKEPIPMDCRSENHIEAEIIMASRSGLRDCSEDASNTITVNSETENGSLKYLSDLKSNRSLHRADDMNQSQRTDELKSSKEEQVLKSEKVEDISEELDADNSLAVLVPVSPCLLLSSSEQIDGDLKMSDASGTFTEARKALKHARKEIERSMERRRIIKAARTQLMAS